MGLPQEGRKPCGVNQKLTDQAAGPYDVIVTDGRTFVIRLGDTKERISSDRIIPAPTRLVENTDRISNSSNSHDPMEADAVKETQEKENVIEKICGAKRLRDGTLRYKVRWNGYKPEDDTWGACGEFTRNYCAALLQPYRITIRCPSRVPKRLNSQYFQYSSASHHISPSPVQPSRRPRFPNVFV